MPSPNYWRGLFGAPYEPAQPKAPAEQMLDLANEWAKLSARMRRLWPDKKAQS